MNEKRNGAPGAMAFYHPDGFIAAYRQAAAFGGESGRVATLPDIIDARLNSELDTPAWGQYFTTMSAEYVGFSRAGNPIAIVAHGVGPMATLDGITAAYSHEFRDKSRNNRGGRISQADFWKLESGGYGDVHVVDLAATWKRREYQFSNHPVTASEILEEPLWQARLGNRWREYISHHTVLAQEWRKGQTFRHETRVLAAFFTKFPCIIAMDSASNCSYDHREIFDIRMADTPNTAIAHLLSISGLVTNHHEYWMMKIGDAVRTRSLSCEVDCHEWWNGTRLAGVRGSMLNGIHSGLPSHRTLMQDHFDKLLVPNPEGRKTQVGFWHLVSRGNEWFTDYPKAGASLDNNEPEFRVYSKREIGDSVLFRTPIGGYHGVVKYGIDELKRIAPLGANAYRFIGDFDIEWHNDTPVRHVAVVQFYRVQVDRRQRIMRMKDVYRNFDLMMQLTAG